MNFVEIKDKAGEIIDFIQEMFPHVFEDISKEEREDAKEIMGYLFVRTFQLINESEREYAMEGIQLNFSSLRRMVLKRVVAEQRENVERLMQIAGKSAAITASIVPAMIMAALSGEELVPPQS